MTLDERFAEFRTLIDADIVRARREGIADVLRVAARIRRASSDAERVVAFEDARKTFDGNALVLEFMKTLAAPPPVSNEETGLRAQRFARVRVAEIQLYQAAAVKTGRATGRIYLALRAQMEAARDAYRENFLTPANGTVDYLHTEFVRTLANDDAALLGPEYPGPLV
jgi:Flp pilus assembly protein CpaB